MAISWSRQLSKLDCTTNCVTVKAEQGRSRMASKDRAEGSGKSGKLDFPRPLTTVDVVIFAILDDKLQVLLVQRPAGEGEPFPLSLALPGGFVDVAKDRDLAACAARKLKEKTGVTSPYLE